MEPVRNIPRIYPEERFYAVRKSIQFTRVILVTFYILPEINQGKAEIWETEQIDTLQAAKL